VDGKNRSGVVAYKSKDLETWEGPQIVFAVPDGLWANPAHGVWAPGIHNYRGKYYLFATLLKAFDGTLMLVAHHPTMSPLSRAKLFDLEDTGDTLRIRRELP
jgi:beta-xylosidase